ELSLDDDDHPTNVFFPEIIPLLQAKDETGKSPWSSVEMDKSHGKSEGGNVALFPRPSDAQEDALASADYPVFGHLKFTSAEQENTSSIMSLVARLETSSSREEIIKRGGWSRIFSLNVRDPNNGDTPRALKHVAVRVQGEENSLSVPPSGPESPHTSWAVATEC
ncbi:unnamed protein product, partial [Amoebophrya sp. A25]